MLASRAVRIAAGPLRAVTARPRSDVAPKAVTHCVCRRGSIREGRPRRIPTVDAARGVEQSTGESRDQVGFPLKKADGENAIPNGQTPDNRTRVRPLSACDRVR
jgi:hypothetical protein